MRSMVAIFVGGLLFGFGLALSRMVRPEVVLGFLQLNDFGLLLTMGSALLITLPTYQLAPRMKSSPLLGGSFDRTARTIAPKHLIGGAIFGVGWGVSGMCPGAAIASVGVGNWPILVGIAGIAIGAYVQGVIANRMM